MSAVKVRKRRQNILSAGAIASNSFGTRGRADVAKLNGHESWRSKRSRFQPTANASRRGPGFSLFAFGTLGPGSRARPDGAHASIWRLEVSSDGKYAACGSTTAAHVWELATGREVRSMPADHRSGYILFAPDGGLVAGTKGKKLSLYPCPKAKPKRWTSRDDC